MPMGMEEKKLPVYVPGGDRASGRPSDRRIHGCKHGALKPLNDAVDGVTGTIDDPELEKRDPAFKPGTSVTLMGDQAEAFLRYRDTRKARAP